jgi:hypothetical protein
MKKTHCIPNWDAMCFCFFTIQVEIKMSFKSASALEDASRPKPDRFAISLMAPAIPLRLRSIYIPDPILKLIIAMRQKELLFLMRVKRIRTPLC